VNKILPFIFFLTACTIQEKEQQKPFPVITVTDDEWATYEGRWLINDGIIRFELSLKTGSFGMDSYYKLRESFESDSLASGALSEGTYSSQYGLKNNELGITLHDLTPFGKGMLRYKKSQNKGTPDEMFFITRGNEELLPCDANFNPITTDWRYTLHKRSKLFTVEGYFTFEQDSAEFFERNTFERWKIGELGEFDKLKAMYNQHAMEKYEGIYLRALAYSVLDTASQREKNALVIKRIKDVGNDPEAIPLE